MPISTFPRHDYDEDEYLLKPAGLRDTHSEGKVTSLATQSGYFHLLTTLPHRRSTDQNCKHAERQHGIVCHLIPSFIRQRMQFDIATFQFGEFSRVYIALSIDRSSDAFMCGNVICAHLAVPDPNKGFNHANFHLRRGSSILPPSSAAIFCACSAKSLLSR